MLFVANFEPIWGVSGGVGEVVQLHFCKTLGWVLIHPKYCFPTPNSRKGMIFTNLVSTNCKAKHFHFPWHFVAFVLYFQIWEEIQNSITYYYLGKGSCSFIHENVALSCLYEIKITSTLRLCEKACNFKQECNSIEFNDQSLQCALYTCIPSNSVTYSSHSHCLMKSNLDYILNWTLFSQIYKKKYNFCFLSSIFFFILVGFISFFNHNFAVTRITIDFTQKGISLSLFGAF
jgi:hypothetical protein